MGPSVVRWEVLTHFTLNSNITGQEEGGRNGNSLCSGESREERRKGSLQNSRAHQDPAIETQHVIPVAKGRTLPGDRTGRRQ